MALPSFFHRMYRVPSVSTKLDASIAPPASSRQMSGSLPTGANGPPGESASAAPMHCRPDAVCHAV